MSTVVYIDGQNFLYKAAEILHQAGRIDDKQALHTISIRKLFEELLQEHDLTIKYYGTKMRLYDSTPEIAERSRIMIDSQRRLKTSLEKQNIEFVEAGRLKLRDSDRCHECGAHGLHFQEKGVDVRLALDLIVDTQNGVDKAVLVSSDNDLLPAVQMAVANGKQVVYVGFSDYLTQSLAVNASEVQIIRNPELITAFDDANS